MINFKMLNKKYISMTGLNATENLGSQMWHFSSLYAISRRTGHQILFFKEFSDLGKGLQLHKYFSNLPFNIVSINDVPESERVHVVYPISSNVIVDSNVFKLNDQLNYNFSGLFISYKYWYPVRQEMRRMYQFDPATLSRAYSLVFSARRTGRQVVAVHVRRGDYINGVFVNLTRDYYEAAFSFFDDDEADYLIFSDDMDWCRREFSGRNNVFFSGNESPIVDMCSMSLCDHNIIANSSFSFWGAFLNRSSDKKVICPAKTLKSDGAIPFVNYAWHPDEFIGLDVGNF